MKVRVTFLVEVDDDIRRQINKHYGKPGLASRKEVQAWYEAHGRAMDDDLSWASQQDYMAEQMAEDLKDS